MATHCLTIQLTFFVFNWYEKQNHLSLSLFNMIRYFSSIPQHFKQNHQAFKNQFRFSIQLNYLEQQIVNNNKQ